MAFSFFVLFLHYLVFHQKKKKVSLFLPFPSVFSFTSFLEIEVRFHALKFRVPQDEQSTGHSLDIWLPDHFLKASSFSNSSHFEICAISALS